MENVASSGSLRVNYSSSFSLKRRKATVPGLVEEDDAVYGSAVITKTASDIDIFKESHRNSEGEMEALALYESHDYMPCHSQVYREWLKAHPEPTLEWDMWFAMSLIGISVGIVGFMMHETVDVITHYKWSRAFYHSQRGEHLKSWVSVLMYGTILVIISSSLVVFMRPSAAGSGIPTLISFLNGTNIPQIFTLDVMMVKFVSCCFAVASGLPVGPEGPMIHLGSLVGAGISQFQSDLLNYKLPYFERFRNPESRRNFISAGAAAGVAAAFNAPVGALLFCMEELSSFWNVKLAWQIFFCATIATVTTDVLKSCLARFQFRGVIGMLITGNIFKLNLPVTVNVAIIIPAAILGVIGGLLGAAFTNLHLRIIQTRIKLFKLIKHGWIQNIVKVVEPVIIMVIVASVSVIAPQYFGCTKYHCHVSSKNSTVISNCATSGSITGVESSMELVAHTCTRGRFIQMRDNVWTNSTYSEVASLMHGTMHDAMMHLFSRRTPNEFGYMSMITVFVFQFFMSCWALCTYVSCGLVIPTLFIGGLYGRLLGISIHDLLTMLGSSYHERPWLDPGAISLIGAASFFGGVSRLTISLTVIMMEVTNEIEFLLPMMSAVMMAKCIGDFFNRPFDHALIKQRCIPFLSQEPSISLFDHRKLDLDLFCAADIMTCNPVVIPVIDSVSHYARFLVENKHGGFPVIIKAPGGLSETLFFGVITRIHLITLLMNESIFQKHTKATTLLNFQQMSGGTGTIVNEKKRNLKLMSYIFNPLYRRLYINIEPYVNESAISVNDRFSLHRAYILFTTLGIRHLTVVNATNNVVGIITRKDLMTFNMEKKLHEKLQNT